MTSTQHTSATISTISHRRGLLALLAMLCGCALWSLAISAPAFADSSTWWHLTTSPTHISTTPEREVQEITTSPNTKGVGLLFELKAFGTSFSKFFGTESYASFGFVTELTAANLQKALEAVYGAGKVEVTGGPAGEPFFVATPTWAPSLEVKQEVGAAHVSVESGGKTGAITVTAVNVGYADVDAHGNPVTVEDKLPRGLEAVGISGQVGETLVGPIPNEAGQNQLSCSLAKLSCTYTGEGEPKALPPYLPLEMTISVVPRAGAKSSEMNEAGVSGGGTPAVSAKRPIPVGGALSFGVSSYEMSAEEEGGEPDTQAGSHPFQLTTTMELDESSPFNTPALAKDLRFNLPPGLIGNPTPVPQCSLADFLTAKKIPGTEETGLEDLCPAQTVVGIARLRINPLKLIPAGSNTVPLFNLEPAHGEPARFGFMVYNVPVILDTSVRTGGDYGVTVTVENISQQVDFSGSEVTFWGVPGDPRHDLQRGWSCLNKSFGHPEEECLPEEQVHPPPLLALPTSCLGSLAPTIEADSWADEGAFATFPTNEPMLGMEGCGHLQFQPSITVAPDGHNASTPTGLAVDVHVPQAVSLDAEGISEADVKDTTVTLPEGVALNPSAGDGLSACSEAAIALDSDALAGCPEAAKVALVRIKTPLLPNPLEGEAYIATQNANPFGSLLALYVYAEDPVSGTRVKIAGEVKLNQQTGQLVTTFSNTPPLPFEEFEIHFFGGERAPLATPAHCGLYTTQATITPWSGTRPVSAESTFAIEHGPNGAPCPGARLPFSPAFAGGTPNVNAGSFSQITTTIGRTDGEQNMSAVSVHLPDGLVGLLSGVKLCPEAQASSGTCGPESLIGETIVTAGVGSDPVHVTGGKVYITEKYDGAPFGLSIVNPVKAGPFDLEHDTANPAQEPSCDCIVVRAKIDVNPLTSALTVTTNSESEGDAIPHMIDGIPVQIQAVNVVINKPGFTFNPTNCEPMKMTGSISGDEGSSAPFSVPFQVTNCAALAFKPTFSVSTQAKTSKKSGASLHVRLAYPSGALGKDANLRYVKVELPKALPSRLETLKHACLESTFNANPASCPATSVIGHAIVRTPVLPVPLQGPAYFVSHGGKEFPSLTIVLEGDGVSVELVGETYISKGVTSSTFQSTPDVPFASFELTLPQGENSALAANGNLCKVTNTVTVKKRVRIRRDGHARFVTRRVSKQVASKLLMPTTMIAQNGVELHQDTVISVTGCGKAAAAQAKQAGVKRARRRRLR